MSSDSKGAFAELAERFGIPVVAVTYVLAFVVGIGESASKLGWRLTAILVCVVCGSWAAYVCVVRKPSNIDPRQRVARFNLQLRVGAVTTALISALPLLYTATWRYPTAGIPLLRVKIMNNTSTPADLWPYADFFLTEPESPLSDRLVHTGRLEFEPADNEFKPSDRLKERKLTIPAKQSALFVGRFRNDSSLVPLLARGDLKFAFIVRTDRGSVNPQDLAFGREDFGKRWILVTID